MSTKKYLSLDGLKEYDALIKAEIKSGDDAVRAKIHAPDWNASDGEAGHIESRTHYIDKTILESVSTTIKGGTSSGDLNILKLTNPVTNVTDNEQFVIYIGELRVEIASLPTWERTEPWVTLVTIDDSYEIVGKITRSTTSGQTDMKNKYLRVADNGTVPSELVGQTLKVERIADEYVPLDENFIPNNIPKIQIATTGQTIVVKSIDENGKPTQWEATGLPDSYTKTESDAQLVEVKSYADTAATNAANTVKNDLLNGAGDAYDTLKELGDLINENQDAIGALETIAAGKADAVHSHDDLYYTESEVDAKIEELSGQISGISSGDIVVAKAEEANHALAADNANEANHAVTADSATSCTGNAATATQATQDADGNVITTTYETKSDAEAKLAEAKEYTDDAILGIPQVDWMQGDSSKADYIINKPTKLSNFENDLDVITPEMIVEMMNETGAAQPIADADNSVLKTDDDKILIL